MGKGEGREEKEERWLFVEYFLVLVNNFHFAIKFYRCTQQISVETGFVFNIWYIHFEITGDTSVLIFF